MQNKLEDNVWGWFFLGWRSPLLFCESCEVSFLIMCRQHFAKKKTRLRFYVRLRYKKFFPRLMKYISAAFLLYRNTSTSSNIGSFLCIFSSSSPSNLWCKKAPVFIPRVYTYGTERRPPLHHGAARLDENVQINEYNHLNPVEISLGFPSVS